MPPHCIVLQGLSWNLHHLSYMYFCLFSTQKHSMKKLHFTLKHHDVEQCDEMRHRRSYTPVNSWSTEMIAFYAETDISILSPKRWLIWKLECHQWWSIHMWKITGNGTRPAEGTSYPGRFYKPGMECPHPPPGKAPDQLFHSTGWQKAFMLSRTSKMYHEII